MTAKEIDILTDILTNEGMSSDKITEIIKYVELTDPKEAQSSQTN